jgi:hypothetical protein
MTAQKHLAGTVPPRKGNRCRKPLLITFRAAAWRRSAGAHLAKWQVAAKDGKSRCGESIRKSDQQWGIAVRSGTVGQDEPVAPRPM